MTLARAVIRLVSGVISPMQQSDPRHVFAARCPHGHRPAQSRTLQELRNPAVQFYCEHCHETWVPATPERIRALQFAEASEIYETPNSAAWTSTTTTFGAERATRW